MIDVHCHLNFHSYTSDFDNVIKEALGNGVTEIINVGTQIDSSQQAIELAAKYDQLYAIVGIHPHHADKVEKGWEDRLKELGKHDKVLGIGEIGLDYYAYKSNGIVDKNLQKVLFEKQIHIAHTLNLPIQIHNRHAGEDVIAILKKHRSLLKRIPGMFHCFASSKEVLFDALNLGFYIGFDGNSTYKGLAPGETVTLNELIELTPIERILTETDSPFLTPEPYRGSRNKPSYVILVGEHIAKVKKIPLEDVNRITTENVRMIFHI
jgi:TatD DNase family protein